FVASWLEGQVSTLICWFLIWTGHFNLWISFGVIVLADIFNDSLYYRMGRKLYKLPRVASFIDKSLFLSEHLATVKRFWFEHPLKTALLGKNAYIISVTIVAAAGVIKMPYGRFLSYTIPTSFVQPTIVLFIGYYLWNSYWLASKYIEYPGIIILIACLIVFFWARKLSKTVTQQIKQDIK
ncbi:MAG: hypothetical protein ACD_80C00047G0008, partial [uncultured bacterium (gcode 4)]